MAQRITTAVLVLTVLWSASVQAHIGDAGSHPPPTTGEHAYYPTAGTFGPGHSGFPGVGGTFVDPVFGSTIRRLTNELPQFSFSEMYAKNGFTNADNTLMYHRSQAGRTFINTTSGQVVRSNVPGNFDSSFAPDDPDVWYWFTWGDSRLNRYNVSTGSSTVVKTFSEALGQLGGSVDFIDGSGRYMVLMLGGSIRVYDVKADILYSGSIPASYASSGGWAGMAPDDNYVVTATDPPKFHSFKIDHGSRSVSTSGVLFWTLCGDHADLVSASNGKTYLVGFECHSEAAIYAVDVTIPQSAGDPPKQRADNRRIIKLASWTDTAGHFSGVSKGAMRDWFFFDIESGDDTFSTPGAWRAYKQEIVMANVLTGEVRRVAHHRSRSPLSNYFYTPRVSASWDGTLVSWVSNFGYSADGYADVYSIRNPGGASSGPSSPPPSSGPSNPPGSSASPAPSSPPAAPAPSATTFTKVNGEWYLNGAAVSSSLANAIINDKATAAGYGVSWPIAGTTPSAPAPPPPAPTPSPSASPSSSSSGSSSLTNAGGNWYLNGVYISTGLANGIMTDKATAIAYGVSWPVGGSSASSPPSSSAPVASAPSSGGGGLQKSGGDWYLNGAGISSSLANAIMTDPATAAAYGVGWPVSTSTASAPPAASAPASSGSGGLVNKNGDWFLKGTAISASLANAILNDPATAAAYGVGN